MPPGHNTLQLLNGDILKGLAVFLWEFSRVSDPHFFFADPDPDPGGIRGRGLGVKEKIFFFSFFHVSDDS